MARVSLETVFINQLVNEMVDSLTDEGLSTLLFKIGRDIQNVVPAGLIKRSRIEKIVSEAQKNDWLAELLQTPIDEATEYGANLVSVCQSVLAEWNQQLAKLAPQSPQSPKDALVLINGAPFVDRDVLRPLIKTLVEVAGPRVLVVRGEPASGKSHLALFITHLVEGEDEVNLAPIDLSRIGSDTIGPRDVMYKLALSMGLDDTGMTSDYLAQEARVAEKLCDWFIGQSQRFRRDKKRWLVVIDGLNLPSVGPGTLDLVDRLVISTARGELFNVKLVLLGWESPLPAIVINEVEDHRLNALLDSDLRQYIERLAIRMGRQLEPNGIDALAEFVLEQLRPPYGHEGLLAIRQRLRQLPQLLTTP